VWAWQEKGGHADYVKIIIKAQSDHPEWIKTPPVVMMGDFNSNWQWDRIPTKNFAGLVETLGKSGLVSAYHLHHNETGGLHNRPTFHQNKNRHKPFHLDYIFIPEAWRTNLANFELGDPEQWLPHSDHCPLTLDISSLPVTPAGH
jgi:endonuclease/exonuclease/phosphatase family metal-dependent hydrolase